jgi:hypothetical protein
MELRNSRNSSDPITSKLCYLSTLAIVNINETVHIAYRKFLNLVIWLQLPLGLQSVDVSYSG